MLIKLLSLSRSLLRYITILYLINCYHVNANPWVRDKYFLSSSIEFHHTQNLPDLQQNTLKLTKLNNQKQQIINSPFLTTTIKQRRLENIDQALKKEYEKRNMIKSVPNKNFKISNFAEYGIENLTIGLYSSYATNKYAFNINKKQFYLAGFAKILLIKKKQYIVSFQNKVILDHFHNRAEYGMEPRLMFGYSNNLSKGRKTFYIFEYASCFMGKKNCEMKYDFTYGLEINNYLFLLQNFRSYQKKQLPTYRHQSQVSVVYRFRNQSYKKKNEKKFLSLQIALISQLLRFSKEFKVRSNGIMLGLWMQG